MNQPYIAKPKDYTKNVDKVAYLANIAKDKKVKVVKLFNDLKGSGYVLSDEMSKMITLYDRGGYDLSKKEDKAKLNDDVKGKKTTATTTSSNPKLVFTDRTPWIWFCFPIQYTI